jgi:hypothetical protein
MGKKMTKAGMVTRRAIRADIDATPAIDHLKIRSKYRISEPIITSAMVKTLAEWDDLIAATTTRRLHHEPHAPRPPTPLLARRMAS